MFFENPYETNTTNGGSKAFAEPKNVNVYIEEN